DLLRLLRIQAPSSKSSAAARRASAHAGRSNADHVEVFLARAAFGAGPVDRDVGPRRSRGNAMLGIAHRLVVDPAADQAHPGTRFAHVDTVTSLQWRTILAKPIREKPRIGGY